MKHTILRSLALAAFLTFFFLPQPSAASVEKTVHVYYTGNGNGEVEPCGCSPKASYGGLKRRGEFFSSISDTQKKIIIETGNFAPDAGEQGRMKLNLLLNSMNTMNYDVIAVQDREKEFIPRISDFSIKSGIPVISAEDDAVFPDTFSKELSGVRFFVHSGTGSLTTENLEKPGIHILLVNKPPSNIMENLNFGRFIDLVIHTGKQYTEARMGKFVQASINKKDGQTIGHISLTFDDNNALKSYSEEQILLSPEMPDDPRIVPLFDMYNKKVADYFEKKSREKRLETGIFLEDKNCKTCHEPFWKQWRETRHSGAWSTLAARGKTSDPDCIPCHTTGYGKKGGFINESRTPGLTNVQCEICHGPGAAHTVNFSKRLKPVNVNICVTCHNKKHSPDFNYDEYLKKIVH